MSLGAVALINSPLPVCAQTGSAPRTAVDSAIVPVALIGVTVIDVETGARRTGVTVLTQGDRIAALGPQIAIPKGASRVSGKGKFLIPGLWDMHSHHQGTGEESLDLFIAKGIVGTRDMGGDADLFCRCESVSGRARCSARRSSPRARWWITRRQAFLIAFPSQTPRRRGSLCVS